MVWVTVPTPPHVARPSSGQNRPVKTAVLPRDPEMCQTREGQSRKRASLVWFPAHALWFLVS